MKDVLEKYKRLFSTLKRDKDSPNKPVLLLTIVSEIELGHLNSSRIPLSQELMQAFEKTWATIVTDKNRKANIAQPFYHLQGDGFWKLVWKEGVTIDYLAIERVRRSKKYQQEYIDYAQLDEELYDLLCNTDSRNALKQILIDNYVSQVQ